MKKAFFLVLSGMLFWACSNGDDSSERGIPHDLQVILDGEKGFSPDTVIYLADSVKFIDMLTQSADFDLSGHPGLDYIVKGMTSGIDIQLQVLPGNDEIIVSCYQNYEKRVVFREPKLPAEQDGFSLKMLDSVKAGDSVFYDVLKFDATDATNNPCNISAFYYGIHDGLVKVVSKNEVEMNRVPAKAYEDAMDRREKERALADSIAQAVADSIIQANTPVEKDSSDDSTVEIPQEILDLADSVSNCIKKAYSSGSLSAIKNCKI